MVMKSQKKRVEAMKKADILGNKSRGDLAVAIVDEACRMMNSPHKNLAILETLVHAYENAPADKRTKGKKEKKQIQQNEDV